MKRIELQRARENMGKKKNKLASESGVDSSYIGYAENRGFQLYDNQLEKLAAALGYDGDPHDLLKEVDDDGDRENL